MNLASSGAGKTALQVAALAFCPAKDLIRLTSLSGKALFSKERSFLKNKGFALEEGDGVTEAMYALRNLITAGELVTESAIKDQATGLVTMANKVEGPTTVFFTTTNPDTDRETKSRFFVTRVDEGRAQIEATLTSQRRRLANDLATELLGHSLDGLSRPAYELLVLLDEMRAEWVKKHSARTSSGPERPLGGGFGVGAKTFANRRHWRRHQPRPLVSNLARFTIPTRTQVRRDASGCEVWWCSRLDWIPFLFRGIMWPHSMSLFSILRLMREST